MELGRKQLLYMVKKTDFGVYLAEEDDRDASEKVLLPAKQVPDGLECGDRISVFLYKDSKDRLIATTNEPALQTGETAVLKVKEVTKIGAFLDWGLEKDLMLPYREMTVRVKPGDEVLAALYVDKSSRLCATMKVYPYLHKNSPYGIGDTVTGRVYEKSDNFGTFVAVDDKYSALIPAREGAVAAAPGKILSLRVTQVLEDGKLNVSTRKEAYKQIEDDAAMISSALDRYSGILPFDDKAAPDTIRSEFGLSKNAFKRAVGHLLKEGEISISDGHIRKKHI
ncbi:MAG: RNA-binding protein [Blautia sp.]|nr:RNA-binding protein [Blautia sp.]